MHIRLIPIGDVPEFAMKAIKLRMEEMGMECSLLGKIPLPKEAYHSMRGQYNGQMLIEDALKKPEGAFIDTSMPTLLVTYADIYFGGSAFVFSLEYPAKSYALISLFRLRPEFYGERPASGKLSERAVKEAVHEIGHHLGLGHCANPRCAMSFSPSVGDVDRKAADFCDACKLKMMTTGRSL